MPGNINVNEKITLETLPARIRHLRKEVLTVDQKTFANLIGASQAVVSQWEKGTKRPSAMALMGIAKIAGPDADWWAEQAGPEFAAKHAILAAYNNMFTVSNKENVTVGVFDRLGPGELRFPPGDASSKISIPREWVGAVRGIIGLRVQGEVLPGLVERGYTVVVRLFPRELKKLENRMVAVIEDDGVASVHWLRKAGGSFSLAPNHGSRSRENVPFKVTQRLAGEVLLWISSPPKSRNSAAEGED